MDANLKDFLADLQKKVRQALDMPVPAPGVPLKAIMTGIDAVDGSGVCILIVSGPRELHEAWMEKALNDSIGIESINERRYTPPPPKLIQ